MKIRPLLFLLTAQFLWTPAAWADSENLLPLTFANFQSSLTKEFNKNAARYPITLDSCLKGDGDKRSACTFKIGDFMVVTIESLKGEQDVVGMTMICAAKDQLDNAKCLIAYISAMSIAASDTNIEQRSKILKLLIEGLAVGNSTTISTSERKFTLQKSLGLWFHIYAFDIPD